MKKNAIRLFVALMLLPGIGANLAQAAPYQYDITVNPDLGSPYVEHIDVPSDNTYCYMFGIDPASHTPRLIPAVNGFTCNGSALNVSEVPQTQIAGLGESLDNIRADVTIAKSAAASATSTANSVASSITSINATMAEISGNLTGTSTTMRAGIAASAGLMSTADKTKLDSLSTSSPLKAYEGTTLRTAAFPIFKSATVSSGSAVFYLTADGTSGGTALFPNGIIQDSINAFVSDATASYQMSYALTNSNKTLTVTANKLSTANILTGVLGQAQANTAVVKLQVWGY